MVWWIAPLVTSLASKFLGPKDKETPSASSGNYGYVSPYTAQYDKDINAALTAGTPQATGYSFQGKQYGQGGTALTGMQTNNQVGTTQANITSGDSVVNQNFKPQNVALGQQDLNTIYKPTTQTPIQQQNVGFNSGQLNQAFSGLQDQTNRFAAQPFGLDPNAVRGMEDNARVDRSAADQQAQMGLQARFNASGLGGGTAINAGMVQARNSKVDLQKSLNELRMNQANAEMSDRQNRGQLMNAMYGTQGEIAGRTATGQLQADTTNAGNNLEAQSLTQKGQAADADRLLQAQQLIQEGRISDANRLLQGEQMQQTGRISDSDRMMEAQKMMQAGRFEDAQNLIKTMGMNQDAEKFNATTANTAAEWANTQGQKLYQQNLDNKLNAMKVGMSGNQAAVQAQQNQQEIDAKANAANNQSWSDTVGGLAEAYQNDRNETNLNKLIASLKKK